MTQRSPYSIVHGQLTALIARMPVNDAAHRKALYEKARRTIADKHPHHLATFEQVIADLESGENHETEPETRMNKETRTESEATTTAPFPGSPAAAAPKSAMGKRMLVAIAGIIVLAAAAAWALHASMQPDHDSASVSEFDNGLAGYSASPTNISPIPADAANYSVVDLGGDIAIEASGPGPLFRVEPIAIDPAKTYRVTARLRVLVNDPEVGGARTYVGVATYDASGEMQNSRPGAHRYAALNNRVVTAEEGWIEVEGIITGAGDENRNQFRVGTTTVRPVALLNYQSPGAVSQISRLHFEEIQNP